jgi:chaperonin cofactor prefoldin
MAEEGDATQGNQKRIETLEKQAKFNGVFIYVTMGITALIVIALTIYIAVIGMRIEQNKPPSSERLEKNLEEIDVRIASLYEQMNGQQQKMKEIEVKVNALNEKQSYAEIGIIQKILIGQQRDFTKFLSIVDDGMINLSNMVRGSRGWTKQYSARLKKAREAVKAQIKEIEKIRSLKGKR